MTTDIPVSITTPDMVETSIGTLNFFDGIPDEKTVGNLYDYMDTARAVQAYVSTVPGVSQYAIRNEQQRSDRSSRTEGLITNDDGSVDLYFGPEAPDGKEINWVQTKEGESFFVYLRLYGPEQAYFDQTFPMTPLQKVK